MKKVVFVLVFSLFIVGAVSIIYVKSNPPLVIKSHASFDGNANVRFIEIENTGVRELQLQNVVVNDGRPDNVQLVVSKVAELGTRVADDPTITYHGMKQINLFPSQYIDRQAVGKEPQHYGLKVEAADIQTITIQYKYLNIPFTLTAELKAAEYNL